MRGYESGHKRSMKIVDKINDKKLQKVLDKPKKRYTILYEGNPSKNSNEDFVDRLLS
jgi:hypothetical protein